MKPIALNQKYFLHLGIFYKSFDQYTKIKYAYNCRLSSLLNRKVKYISGKITFSIATMKRAVMKTRKAHPHTHMDSSSLSASFILYFVSFFHQSALISSQVGKLLPRETKILMIAYLTSCKWPHHNDNTIVLQKYFFISPFLLANLPFDHIVMCHIGGSKF